MKIFQQIIILVLTPIFVNAIPAEGQKIMIAAPSPYAVAAGKEIAQKGGNVVDVSVAIALTLSVTSPYFAAFGGGGFALVKIKDDVEVLDFREVGPAKTSPKYYLDKAKDASYYGGTAVGVPGIPAGLWALHQKHGKLSWKKLFKTALHLAKKGFQVSGEWSRYGIRVKEKWNQWGKQHFLKKNQDPYLPGDILVQRPLSRALQAFKSKGHKGFYEGAVAKDVVRAVQETQGDLSLEDFKNYKVRWLKPIQTQFAGHDIYLMPPPSSGGVVIFTALKLIEKLKLSQYSPLSVDELHLFGEIMSRSFRGRAQLGDPDFHKNPLSYLMSEGYIKKMAKTISRRRVKKLKPLVKIPKESSETTHFSVMDAQGRAVAMTVTLNGVYGSKVVSQKFGIALNNEMDDFTARPGEPNMFGLVQGEGNQVEAGKRPLSSMSPTLVGKNGKIVMSLGSPGGPRIINAVLQTLYRVLINGMDMDAAIQFPRVHHQFLPHILFVDRKRFAPETLKGLEKRGHKVKESSIARVYGVRLNAKGLLEGAFDSRGEGGSGGF